MTAPSPPRVAHKREASGGVHIGRPSKWGNPFRIGRDGTREEVIAKYRAWIMSHDGIDLREAAKRELRGKVLVCYCAPLPCHGDVLLEVANSQQTVDALTSERDALRAEVERLKTNRDWWMESCQQAQTHRDGANAQLAVAEAEVERLTADLADARGALRYIRQGHGDLYGVGWDRVLPR